MAAAKQSVPPEDCLACRLIGTGAFALLGLYAIGSARYYALDKAAGVSRGARLSMRLAGYGGSRLVHRLRDALTLTAATCQASLEQLPTDGQYRCNVRKSKKLEPVIFSSAAARICDEHGSFLVEDTQSARRTPKGLESTTMKKY